jgi:hypothetical protein
MQKPVLGYEAEEEEEDEVAEFLQQNGFQLLDYVEDGDSMTSILAGPSVMPGGTMKNDGELTATTTNNF